ncbi:MAG: C40 family peptidase [Bacteroidales bacterium]
MKNIKCISIHLLSLTAILLLTQCKFSSNRQLLNQIDSISFKYVPDNREGIFNIRLSRKGFTLILKGETSVPQAKTEIINLLQNKKIKFVDSLIILPDTLLIKKYRGLVCVSVCNIRSKPFHSAELVSQALMGTPVKILKINKGWYFLQTPDRYLGWVEDDAVNLLTESEFRNWKSSPRIIFTGKTGDIYSDEQEEMVVSDIVAGCILIKKGENTQFILVTLPDGRQGKVCRKNCTDFTEWASRTRPEPEKLCKTATGLTGIPYLWGGTSTKGMDCSGFVKTVYFLNGLIIARDVSLQIRHGIFTGSPLPIDSLKKGDLLYFGSAKNGTIYPTHVGMYIGNKEYIHSSGMVRINSFDSTKTNFSRYRYNTFLGAGRIIGAYPAEGSQTIEGHSWYFN